MSAISVPLLRVGTLSNPLDVARAKSIAGLLSRDHKNAPATPAEVFVVEGATVDLHAALRNGSVDMVVGSATESASGSDTATAEVFPRRGDSRDALCATGSLTLDTLVGGARVVVDSARRRAQVLARRADLVVDVLAEEAASLLAVVETGGATAAVVAVADLDGLHRLDAITEFLGIDGWPTDAGQGASAVMVLHGAEKTVKALGHNPTRIIVDAELGVRNSLGESGALTSVHGIIDDGLLFLSARVYAPDGSAEVTSSHALYLNDVAHPASELSARVAAESVALGAHGLTKRTP